MKILHGCKDLAPVHRGNRKHFPASRNKPALLKRTWLFRCLVHEVNAVGKLAGKIFNLYCIQSYPSSLALPAYKVFPDALDITTIVLA